MKILLLAGNTLRSRSYAQLLIHCDEIEVSGLFYGSNLSKCFTPNLNEETKRFFVQENIFLPDLSKTLQETFEMNHWDFSFAETDDVNSEEIINRIGKYGADIIIFSGYGGQILSKDHFTSQTPYLHMHPGLLPEERGSTTIYYSILNKKKCSVTGFFMTHEIDAGKIIIQKQYSLPTKGVNIDSWYDNVLRADCLLAAIKILQNNNTIFFEPGNEATSEEYYIIHPVLKHLAVLSIDQ